MRDINDLNNEYLSNKAFRLKKVFESGQTTYVGKIRVEEWMIQKIVVSGSETSFSEANRFNNDYDNLDEAWSNKTTLNYE